VAAIAVASNSFCSPRLAQAQETFVSVPGEYSNTATIGYENSKKLKEHPLQREVSSCAERKKLIEILLKTLCAPCDCLLCPLLMEVPME
jgi:hypothetical protein